MAAFHGKAGSVQFSGTHLFNITSWTLNATAGLEDATTLIGDVSPWSDSFGVYALGAVVSYVNNIYQCHVSHTAAVGKEPTETAWWTPVVGNKSKLLGYLDWTIEVEGYFDTTNPSPNLDTDFKDADGDEIILNYQTAEQGGKKITTEGVVSDMRFGVDKDGVETVAYTFVPANTAGRTLTEGDDT